MLVRKGAITRDINENSLPEYKAKGYGPVEVEDPEVEDPEGEKTKGEKTKTKGEK